MLNNHFICLRATIILPFVFGFFISGNVVADESSESHIDGTVGHRPSYESWPHTKPKVNPQRHDLKNEYLLDFKHNIISDNAVHISFQADGDPNCYGRRVILEETDDAIGIAVVTGTLIGAPKYCTLVGLLGSFELHTQRPIGNRKIVHLTSVELK